MKSFAVLGLGRFGRELAIQLSRQGEDVLAVDRDRKCVDDVADDVTRAVTANFKEEDVLEELGVSSCDVVILSVGSDLALSVITLMNLKSLGVKHIICKAYDEMYRDVLLRLGANEVILPERAVAAKLAARLSSTHLRDYLMLSEDTAIEERSTPKAWCNKTIGELRIRNRYKVNVIALRRNTETIIAIEADTLLLPNDVLVLLAQTKDLQEIIDMA